MTRARRDPLSHCDCSQSNAVTCGIHEVRFLSSKHAADERERFPSFNDFRTRGMFKLTYMKPIPFSLFHYYFP
jgi:hypothetical protein